MPEHSYSAFDLNPVELKALWNSVPDRQAFIEEKCNVLERLVPELQKIYPDSSGYLWGSTVGDIDITVISPEFRYIPDNLKERFPIVDWVGLEYFTVPSASALIKQLGRCEKLYADKGGLLTETELSHVRDIINSVRHLWGDPSVFDNVSLDTGQFLACHPIPSHLLYELPLGR